MGFGSNYLRTIGLVAILSAIGSSDAFGQLRVERQLSSKPTVIKTASNEETSPIFSESYKAQREIYQTQSEATHKPEIFVPVTYSKNILDVEPSPFRAYDSGTILRREAKKFLPKSDFIATKVDIGEKKIALGSFELDAQIKLRSEGVVVIPAIKIPVLNASLEPRVYNGSKLDEVNLRFKAFKGDGIISYKQDDKYPITTGYVRSW